MAKKRTVFVDVIVDDKGTTKKLAIDSKRLSDGMEKGSKGTKDFDRNLRGVIGTAQAGGRNFAALAQGIAGGIVPVYAAFAAQVFAIGAAFRFLSAAGDLATLEKGQVAYASSTGIALKTLTTRIQEATAGQIAFQDAAQAAAIGTAAGLSADQLTRLGTAAKDASIILGRDVTDSFNRLVRGVTKAEPELLDELGIILRLKDATETYAASLGKSANDLTQFEKSQAVANDVLDQAEKKYSQIIDIVDPSINQFNAFGKAFDDIVNSIKKGLNALLGPIAGILAKNPFATLLLAAPLLNGFLKVLLPGFEGVGNAASNALDGIGSGLERAKKNANVEFTSLKLLAGDAEAASEFVKLTNEDLVDLADSSETGFLGLKKLQSGGQLAGRTITKNLNDAKNATGAFANMPKKVRLEYIRMFTDLQLASKVTNNKMKADFAEGTSFIKLKFAEVKLAAVNMMAGVVNSVKNGVRKVITNFAKVASGIGIVTTLFQFLPKQVREFFETIEDPNLRKFREELVTLNEETAKFVQVQTKLNEEFEGTGKTLPEVAKNIANLVGQVSNTRDLETLEEIFKAIADRGSLTQSAGALADVNDLIDQQQQRFQTLIKAIQKTNLAYADQSVLDYIDQIQVLNQALINARNGEEVEVDRAAYLRAKNAIQEYGNVVKGVLDRNKTLQDEFNKSFSGLVAKGPYSEISSQLNKQIAAYDKLKIAAEGAEGTGLALTVKRVEQHRRLNKLFNDEISRLNKIKVAEVELDRFQKKVGVGATTRGKQRIANFVAEQKELNKVNEIQGQIDFTVQSIAENNQPITEDQKKQLALLKLQQQQHQTNLDTMVEQRSAAVQINQALAQGLETGLQKNIYDLLVGNENDLKDAALKVAQSVYDTLAQRLSGMLTDSILGGFGIQSEEDKLKETYKTIFADGALAFDTVMNDFESKIQQKQAEIFGAKQVGKGVDGKGASIADTFAVAANKSASAAERLTDAFNSTIDAARSAQKVVVTNAIEIGQQIYNSVRNAALLPQGGAGGMYSPVIPQMGQPNTIPKIIKSKDEVDDMEPIPVDPKAIERARQAMETDTQNRNTDTENVNEFGNHIMTLGQHLLRASGPAGAAMSVASTIIGSFFSGLGSSYGPSEGRYGMKPRSMSLGGIARGPQAGYPAVLHGTEAVIPMPSGSIPVEMKGGAGGVNNISVNVNMADGSTDVQGGEQGGGNLGKLLASAVQTELQKQKRPGGILSPHGAA